MCNAPEIWNDLKSVIHKVLESTDELQKQNRKGSLQYLLFSFMQYGVCLGILEMSVCTYFIPLLEEIECISEKTKYNKIGNRITELVLDYEVIRDKVVLK